jgi:hypothetical protein
MIALDAHPMRERLKPDLPGDKDQATHAGR